MHVGQPDSALARRSRTSCIKVEYWHTTSHPGTLSLRNISGIGNRKIYFPRKHDFAKPVISGSLSQCAACELYCFYCTHKSCNVPISTRYDVSHNTLASKNIQEVYTTKEMRLRDDKVIKKKKKKRDLKLNSTSRYAYPTIFLVVPLANTQNYNLQA